jgi:CubicO group peptidase (beta-lactamase class C family)
LASPQTSPKIAGPDEFPLASSEEWVVALSGAKTEQELSAMNNLHKTMSTSPRATYALLMLICFCPFAVWGQEAAKKDSKAAATKSPAAPQPPAAKEQKPTAAPAPAIRAGNVSDPADLEAFFDGVINVQLESKHIAGAVVAVVVGDKVVFSKGYGYADIEARRRVDPEKTLFRIASISKLFTWTAVMQQVEEGKLDLDTDVNKYLKGVQVPATFEQPITLRHLLTHTPGFDDYVIGLFGRKSEDVGPLAQILKAQMPNRVRPPGVIASYSNHGTAIAGEVVACVAGMPWEDYIDQRILKPLGMQNTLARQPETDKLPAGLSKGYKWEDARFEAKDFEYCPAAPAGCISTTAADAAKFMLAHLHDGALGDKRILKPETARKMREPLFRHDPKTCAMCYGFWELQKNGQRIVGHGGDTLWFHSLLQMIPERGVGLFVSYNTDTSAGQREAMFDTFMRRYFPAPDPDRIQAGNDAHERAKKLAGEYRVTRYSHSTLTKLIGLVSVLRVKANDDDSLTIGIGDRAHRFVEVEPLVYRDVDGPDRFVFQADKNGNPTYLFPADAAAVAAVKLPWYDTTIAHGALVGVSVVIFLSALFFWPAIAFSVRGLKAPAITRNGLSAFLSCLAWLLSAACIGFAGCFLLYFLSEPDDIVFGFTPRMKALLAVPQGCAVLAGLTVMGCLLAWRKRYWRVSGRLHYTLVALAGIGFIWFLYYWNLLAFGWKDFV